LVDVVVVNEGVAGAEATWFIVVEDELPSQLPLLANTESVRTEVLLFDVTVIEFTPPLLTPFIPLAEVILHPLGTVHL
jgi:hypothetical protein